MAYSSKQQEAAWAKTNGSCWYCGARLGPETNFSVDRIEPRARGGTDVPSNLVPACRQCNTLKGTGTVEDLRLKLGREHGRVQPPEGVVAVVGPGGERIPPRRLEPRELYEFYFERMRLKP